MTQTLSETTSRMLALESDVRTVIDSADHKSSIQAAVALGMALGRCAAELVILELLVKDVLPTSHGKRIMETIGPAIEKSKERVVGTD